MPSLQVRDLPEHVHRTLKARAALEGKSLSTYVQAELERLAERPTRQEILDRLADRPPVDLPEHAADALADERSRR